MSDLQEDDPEGWCVMGEVWAVFGAGLSLGIAIGLLAGQWYFKRTEEYCECTQTGFFVDDIGRVTCANCGRFMGLRNHIEGKGCPFCEK